MAEQQVQDLLALCLQRLHVEDNSVTAEMELLQVVENYECVRRRWLQAELEVKRYKELLVKSDVSKAALEVKLKHARNQLDVEMKKRSKVEGDYYYLQRQMQLMCDILVHDNKSSSFLNEEQKSLLATFQHGGPHATQRSSRRLTVIDESSFLSHSDISYDRTDDDVDLHTTVIKPLRSRVREKRRSSMGPLGGAVVVKRNRNVSAELLERKIVEKEVETIVKASLMTPEPGGQIHMMVGPTQESPETPRVAPADPGEPARGADLTSVWSPCDDTLVEPDAPTEDQKTAPHVFLSKTVIWAETCSPCGKRIRFGKVAMKCRTCRVVAHAECKKNLPDGCSPPGAAAPGTARPDSLEGFAPPTRPRVPQLVLDCVAELERRGLQERGLYRVPGAERLVRELSDRVLLGKPVPPLRKVQDVHVVCGLLKDFLRRLREPLLTFRLHRTFMEAAELQDQRSSAAVFCRAVAELPRANRDTLAFIMLHLHRVMRSPPCQMDQKNLARVLGPTVVGHGMSEPSPSTIMRDANTQPKVLCCLLALPEDYWRQVLQADHHLPQTASTSNARYISGHLFQPLTSPESRTTRSSASPNTGPAEPFGRFFTSPTASERS